MSLTKSNHKVY